MAAPSTRSVEPNADSATGGAATSGSTSGASHNVVLPPTISAGDLIMVFGRIADGPTVSFPAGWTVVTDSSDSSTDVAFYAYKDTLAAGTEDGTSITVTHTGSRMAAKSYAIQGAADPAVIAPEHTIANGSTSPMAGPAINPTDGPKDFYYLAFYSNEGEQTLSKTAPSGYSGAVEVGTGTGGATASNCQVGTWSKGTTNTSSETPGTVALSAAGAWIAFTIAIHPPPPAGTPHTYTQPDALGIADDLSFVLGKTVTVNDALGVGDTRAIQQTKQIVIPDNLGVTDARTIEKGVLRSVADDLGITDARAVNLGKSVVVNDALGVTDARVLARGLSISDALAITDGQAFLVALQRSINDALGITDQATPSSATQRLITDALGIMDATAATKVQTRDVNDALGIADSRSFLQAHGRTINDALGIADSRVFQGAFLRAINDALGVTDARAPSLGVSLSQQDALDISDQALTSTVAFRSVDESLVLTDEVATSEGYARTISDALGITDSMFGIILVLKELQDTLALADAQTLARGVGLQDILTIEDSMTRSAVLQRTVADSFGIADSIAANIIILKELADVLGITDARAFMSGYQRSVADNLLAADQVTTTQGAFRSLAESLTVEDALTSALPITRLVADTLGIGDAVTFDRAVEIGDLIVVVDEAITASETYRDINDLLTMSDNIVPLLLDVVPAISKLVLVVFDKAATTLWMDEMTMGLTTTHVVQDSFLEEEDQNLFTEEAHEGMEIEE